MHGLDVCLVVLAGFGLTTQPVADIHVDGSAPNCAMATGVAGDPVCSINAALAIASPGDTIRIAPGTYFEHLAITMDLDLVGDGGDEVTILDGGGAGGSVITIAAATTVIVDGLTVTGGRSRIGAGIRTSGDLTLRNSTVSGNRAESPGTSYCRGGGIATIGVGVLVTLDQSTVSDNEVFANYPGNATGGGISVRDGELVIRNSTIDGNRLDSEFSPTSHTEGAGLHASRSTILMSGSTVSRNQCLGNGGGIFVFQGSVSMSNSTLSSNSGLRGAALYTRSPMSSNTLSSVTVTENVGFVTVVQAYPVSIRNTVIANNLGTDLTGATSLGNNLIGAHDGAGFVSGPGDLVGTPVFDPIDPRLGPLADNGGLTGTHRPLPGSPLIDAGNPMQFELEDQRGLSRPLGNAPDIGAVELNTFPSLCLGDGGDQMGCTDCPCSNNAFVGSVGGCWNSRGASAELLARGTPSVSQPAHVLIDLRFGADDLPPETFCVLVSGDAVAPTQPSSPCFGMESGVQAVEFDGLRCATTNVRRHGGRVADMYGDVGEMTSPWGGEGAPPAGIAQAMGGFSSGQVRFFQCVYRDDPLLGCMRGLNTTQTLEVVFTP